MTPMYTPKADIIYVCMYVCMYVYQVLATHRNDHAVNFESVVIFHPGIPPCLLHIGLSYEAIVENDPAL